MATNPLFPTNTGPQSTTPKGGLAPPAAAGTTATAPNATNPAADLIRQKLARIYGDEPDATQEITASAQPGVQHSRHQLYMQGLSASGKSLAEIQTAWHQYYASLPDDEKRAVWQEFYSHGHGAQAAAASPPATPAATTAAPEPQQPRVPASIYPEPTALHSPASYRPPSAYASQPDSIDFGAETTERKTVTPETPAAAAGLAYEEDSRTPTAIRDTLRRTVSGRAKLQPKHHIQSLVFGLGCGGLALLVVMLGFFNQLIFAPFIQPSRTVNATPIIMSPDGIAPTDKAEVVIPKINVQIPLDFSVKTIKEDDVQKGLENGVVHYPTTALPGQQGNAAFFGHSSNNIFNPGKYKFAFVLLHELVPGDTFYLTRDGVAYSYVVIDKKVVEPTEIGVLDPIPGKTATATLITCDPPGTTLRRLAVIGEQISPSPSGNTPGAPAPVAPPDGGSEPVEELPGDAPSLWRRMTGWITS